MFFKKQGFLKKGFLKNFVKFIKHLGQSLFFNKVTDLRPATLLKKRLWHRCFLMSVVKFLRTPFLQNTSGQLLLRLICNPPKHLADHQPGSNSFSSDQQLSKIKNVSTGLISINFCRTSNSVARNFSGRELNVGLHGWQIFFWKFMIVKNVPVWMCTLLKCAL